MSFEVGIAHNFPSSSIDVCFDVDEPGITALFGHSGAGKTTIVNAVAGLLQPQQGRIAIDGEVLLDTARGIRVPPRKRRLGYVFQEARLFPHLSVGANLLFGRRRARQPASVAEVDRVIEMLGLGPLLGRKPRSLSGGERQRVALGRALLSSPRMLLLDEPLAALDEARKQEILPYLERLRDEARLPILYVSHSIEEVTRLSNEMIVIDGGRVRAQGTVFDLMTRLELFAITGRFEAGAVLRTRVRAHHGEDHLTELVFSGGTLWVPRIDAIIGTEMRVRIRARDVTIALDQPQRISANNLLRGTIIDIRSDAGGPYADVQMQCGNERLVAEITHRSLIRLALAPGREVFAIIKSVTAEGHGAGRALDA